MAEQPAIKKKKGGIPTWGYIAAGGVVLAYILFVRRAQAQSAAASQSQTPYPVNVSYPPNNTGAAATAALLSLLGSGGGAPGSVKVSTGNTPPSFFHIDTSQAKHILGGGGAVYYQPAAGVFVPITDLSQAPSTTQLFGTSMLSPTQPGQQLGSPA